MQGVPAAVGICFTVANVRRFAMAAAVPVRADYDAARLRALAKQSEDADQTRRLLALAVIYDSGSRREAAKVGGVGLQTVRDWVLAFKRTDRPVSSTARRGAGQAAAAQRRAAASAGADRRDRPDPGRARGGP